MEARGILSGAHRTLKGELVVELTTDSTKATLEAIKELTDRDIDIRLTPHREKRSLNANAYFHVLCGKIAEKAETSITEAKNQLIAEYGAPEIDEDGKVQHVILKESIDHLKVTWIHLRPTQKVQKLGNGELYRVYLIMRGSHTYNVKEMARLIDGTVAEAKELDIETMTPEELDRLKSQWKEETWTKRKDSTG